MLAIVHLLRWFLGLSEECHGLVGLRMGGGQVNRQVARGAAATGCLRRRFFGVWPLRVSTLRKRDEFHGSSRDPQNTRMPVRCRPWFPSMDSDTEAT